uniref:Uncharacterized protein n=1 Tax=Strombidium rassoulzadegani TaxID=1082188 RepID=A0A7S3CTH0_9SPIT|mmetsp:Transcript_8481/g.14256  ORF Transcript_8481/g.14256 Transcript_8481/m.14256 type:complete len:201 (+) Transcript_8481:383-985(+)
MYVQDEQKFDLVKDISRNMNLLLREIGSNISLLYNWTSIYDLTIFQTLSQVIQRMLPQVQFITQLMDTFVKQSQIQKAFLFDVKTKIHIATDENPVEMMDYEICSELIDVLIDVSSIYGSTDSGENLKFDDHSGTKIRLHQQESDSDMNLILRQVDKSLALVCLINENKIVQQHLLNHNIDVFKDGLKKIFAAYETSKFT